MTNNDKKLINKLKNSDINLTKKNINCNFSKGFIKQQNNRTYNHQNILGENLLYKILLIIFLLFFIYFSKKNNNYNKVIVFLLICSFIKTIKKDRMTFLYCISNIISKQVNTPPYLDRKKYFPQSKLFELPENFKKIKKEILDVYKYKKNIPLTKNTFGKQNYYIGGGKKQNNNKDGWKILPIKLGDKFTKVGLKLCPFLCKILKKVKKIRSCLISILPSKKAIPIHVGYYKGVIRYQLGVIIPKDRKNVFICVNGIKYSWKEGEGVLFDDTYPHKVYNNSNEDRVILYIDVERPFLGKKMDKLNKYMIKMFEKTPEVKKQIKDTEKQIKII